MSAQGTLAVGAALLAGTALAASGGQSAFRTGVEVVGLAVTVLDGRGRHVTDLTMDDFEIKEEGRPQTITYFARGSDDERSAPLHLGMLFDTSGSMESDLGFSRNAVIRFLGAPTRAVDITLVDFDSEVRVARFADADFARIIERIQRRPAKGFTALYDAIGIYLAGAFDQTGRKVLVVYTDGVDTSSAQSFEDTMKLLRASDVTVYTIGFVQHTPSSMRFHDESRLRLIAEVTGGQTFFPRSMKELDAAYASVLAEIRALYDIGYVPTNQKRDGGWRRVEISVVRPGLRNPRIRARKGYFAPYEKPAR